MQLSARRKGSAGSCASGQGNRKCKALRSYFWNSKEAVWLEQRELIEIFFFFFLRKLKLSASIPSSGFRIKGIENSAGILRSDVLKLYFFFPETQCFHL